MTIQMHIRIEALNLVSAHYCDNALPWQDYDVSYRLVEISMYRVLFPCLNDKQLSSTPPDTVPLLQRMLGWLNSR